MRLKKNSFITKLFGQGKPKPKTYSATEYGIAPEGFDRHAREVVKVLQEKGFEAYVVGGGVRDQLLSLHPKDFDIATNARPEEIKKCFQRCIIIGRRFRLAHVYFGRYDFIEVATFRKEQPFTRKHLPGLFKKSGIVARDNLYGTLEEDAFRRDFTINALYYDPVHQHILDFTKGMEDIAAKVLRLIGKPSVRLREDPVRILRALRISNKLRFQIDPLILNVMPTFVPLLGEVAGGRLFDEYQKLFLHGDAVRNFASLIEWNILIYFFPGMMESLANDKTLKIIDLALHNTDARYQSGQTINPAFLISVFLWHALTARQLVLRKEMNPREAFQTAMRTLLKEQTKTTNMPGYLPDFIEQVWTLQRQLERRHKPKVLSILTHPRYRAAYDFLLLRSQIGEVKPALCEWWRSLYEMSEAERISALGA